METRDFSHFTELDSLGRNLAKVIIKKKSSYPITPLTYIVYVLVRRHIIFGIDLSFSMQRFKGFHGLCTLLAR